MSGALVPGPASPVHRGPALPAVARAALLVSAWLPFFAAVVFILPRFEPFFVKLLEKHHLPMLSRWLLWLAM